MAVSCGVCQKPMEDNAAVCPHCGAANAFADSLSIDNSIDELLGSMLSEALPRAARDSADRPFADEAGEPAAAADTLPPGEESTGDTQNTPAESAPAEQTPDIDGFSIADPLIPASGPVAEKVLQESQQELSADDAPAEPEARKNALESSFGAQPREAYGYKPSKFLLVTVALAALALFSAIIMFIVLPKQQVNREKTQIVNFLEGAWISDKFAFFDSTSKNYVEVLIVDGDGGFTMLYTVPDEAYPDGWSNGKWKIEEQVEGSVDFIAEEQTLLLLYEQDAANYFFERVFVERDDDRICLREFYDESGENYYDVVLHRIKMPQDG